MNPIAYEDLNRKIFVNEKSKNLAFKYPTNMIKTRKYTVWTFFPKALYLQFLRVANIYFLFIAIISSFEEFSPISPITSVIPLVFVLTTSIVREALEDWSRFKNDRVTNKQKTLIHKYQKTRGTEYANKYWEDIHVGDIIKIENNDEIPADVVILTSSDESGIAYVETANLDGEKNLKLKQAKPEIHDLIKTVGIDYIAGAMLIDSPNGKIHKFRGVIELEGLDTLYLGYNNLLLRGTFLKNTTYALGLVVYTGHDTKLLRNQGGFRNKKSHLEKKLNWYIFMVFIIQMIMCLILTMLALVFRSNYLEVEARHSGPKLSYLFPDEASGSGRGAAADAIITFVSFILLLNTMIPISLVVSLEIAKLLQTISIDLDQLMWTDDQRSKVLNMLIHEDLSKIEYIFADKTGTLTSNEMRFITCSINGVVYTKEELMDLRENSICVMDIKDAKEIQAEKEEKEKEKDDNFSLFWLALTLCHEVIIDSRKEDSLDFREKYQGSSPDEVELVSIAAELNYVFEAKRNELYVLKFKGETREFRLLGKIDFNSDRKRMSVIMKDNKSGKLLLFCKGADNIMLKRLREDTPIYIQDKTKDDIHSMSLEGLRTLVIAYKELDEKQYLEWNEKYYNAQLGGFNVLSEEDPAEKIKKLEDEIEHGMELLGATGLEDKLQEGVGETIIDLHKAGIKIWMLTGDKLETAENIGHATNLIAKDTKSFKIRTHDVDSTLKRFQKIKEKMRNIVQGQVIPADCSNIIGGPEQSENLEVPSPPPQDEYDSGEDEEEINYKSFALIIDGDAINYTFHNEDLKKIFLDLIPQFRTVICCRSTPSQKADVVVFVKTNLKKMTLAIGDGGNDVNMIQKADVGVGIFGKEGHQAAYASDYAFARFFFLWRLLLVHGRWAYIRTANFINFFFYKNLIFTLPQFWFALYSGYSGQSIYDDVYTTNYNTVFTSVAPVYYSAQERDIDPRESENIREALPYVYAEFRRKELFSGKKFLYWWFMGFAHSVIIFYTIIQSFDNIADSEGRTFELWRESVVSICSVFFSVFVLFLIETSRFDCIAFLCYVVFTLLAFFPVGTIIMDVISKEVDNVLGDVLGTYKFWGVIVFTTLANAGLIYIPRMYMSFFHPSLVELLARDRNKRWGMQKNPKVTGTKSEDTISFSEKKFDFNANIMQRGWYAGCQ